MWSWFENVTASERIALASTVAAFIAAIVAWRYAKRSADLAERSATAAEESARIAREATMVSQRAWITVRRVVINHQDSETGTPLAVTVVLHNGGQSPATRVRLEIGRAHV